MPDPSARYVEVLGSCAATVFCQFWTCDAITQSAYMHTTPLVRHLTSSESRLSGRYNRITSISMDQGHEITIYGICWSRNLKLPSYNNTSLLNRVKEIKFPVSVGHRRFNRHIYGRPISLCSLSVGFEFTEPQSRIKYSSLLGTLIPYSSCGSKIGLTLHSLVMGNGYNEA